MTLVYPDLSRPKENAGNRKWQKSVLKYGKKQNRNSVPNLSLHRMKKDWLTNFETQQAQ